MDRLFSYPERLSLSRTPNVSSLLFPIHDVFVSARVPRRVFQTGRARPVYGQVVTLARPSAWPALGTIRMRIGYEDTDRL